MCITLVFVAFLPVQGAERNGVGVSFGEATKEDGIRVSIWRNQDGATAKTYAGQTGLETNLVQGAWGIGCDVSDDFIYDGTHRVIITVEYWDKEPKGEQAFKLYYDSVRKSQARARTYYFEGSKTWKKATYFLEDARFAGRQDGGVDFQLLSTDTDLCVRRITVEKVPDEIPAQELRISPASFDMIEGERKILSAIFEPFQATDKLLTWRSSNPNVAAVGAYGLVYGIAEGRAVITAVQEEGKRLAASCTVRVHGVPGEGAIARRASDFLDSIGINTSINQRGETLQKTIECVKYLGVRWIRSTIGMELEHYKELNEKAGVRFSLSFHGRDAGRFIRKAREIEDAGLLIAFEGPNEPNNWGIEYQGERGGGADTWIPVAKYQRDFYAAVKSDPVLRAYPVWHLTEGGAQTDNVGLQFLTIPKGAATVMPPGTQYADYANCHNYVSHPGWPGLHDNQAWLASEPTTQCRVSGLNWHYGTTWARKYIGYSVDDLLHLPRVSTETGVAIHGDITEEIQARLYLDIYLAQFAQGWSHTSIYLLRDRVDEGGNQTYGFYRPDYTPRKAAVYMHNLTTILADHETTPVPGRLKYSIPDQPDTVHDLLLQKSDGTFWLVVWNERYGSGSSDNVTVKLGEPYDAVNLYDPTVGFKATQTLNRTDTVTFTLTNNPVVIELMESRGGAGEVELLSEGLAHTAYTTEHPSERSGPAKAFDGDWRTIESAWCNGASYPQWLMVDLGRQYKIIKILTFMEKPNVWYSYKIEVSDDKENWTMFSDQTANKESSEEDAYTDMGFATGRYVRLTLTDASDSDKSWFWPAVREFQVYGVAVGER